MYTSHDNHHSVTAVNCLINESNIIACLTALHIPDYEAPSIPSAFFFRIRTAIKNIIRLAIQLLDWKSRILLLQPPAITPVKFPIFCITISDPFFQPLVFNDGRVRFPNTQILSQIRLYPLPVNTGHRKPFFVPFNFQLHCLVSNCIPIEGLQFV